MDFLPQFQARPALAITDLPHESNWMFFVDGERASARTQQPPKQKQQQHITPVQFLLPFCLLLLLLFLFPSRRRRKNEGK
jgi:hypothetical protein